MRPLPFSPMRPVKLGRIAIEAEGVRWKARAASTGRRATFGAIAAVFTLFVLAFGHVAGYLELLDYTRPVYAALIVLGVDLLFAIVFGVIAARGGPGVVETEALDVRNNALQQLAEYGAVTTMVPVLLRRLPVRGIAGAVLAAALARVLARRA